MTKTRRPYINTPTHELVKMITTDWRLIADLPGNRDWLMPEGTEERAAELTARHEAALKMAQEKEALRKGVLERLTWRPPHTGSQEPLSEKAAAGIAVDALYPVISNLNIRLSSARDTIQDLEDEVRRLRDALDDVMEL